MFVIGLEGTEEVTVCGQIGNVPCYQHGTHRVCEQIEMLWFDLAGFWELYGGATECGGDGCRDWPLSLHDDDRPALCLGSFGADADLWGVAVCRGE